MEISYFVIYFSKILFNERGYYYHLQILNEESEAQRIQVDFLKTQKFSGKALTQIQFSRLFVCCFLFMFLFPIASVYNNSLLLMSLPFVGVA